MKYIWLIAVFLILTPFDLAADTLLCQIRAGEQKDKVSANDALRRGPNRCIERDGRALTLIRDIYGSGVNDDLTIAAGASASLDGIQAQYKNISIGAGATLTVRSGTILRCIGTFSLSGTIVVTPAASGAKRAVNDLSSFAEVQGAPAHAGASVTVAENGSIGQGADVVGGAAGVADSPSGLGTFQLTRFAGGGGGVGRGSGGKGGGSFMVACRGEITVALNGLISAPGEDAASSSGGGGAGGLVVLASGVRVTLRPQPAVDVSGGNGGNSETSNLVAVAPGGGGAGGYLHIISPDYSANLSPANLSGGTAGTIVAPSVGSAFKWVGGGAGGSLFAAGGAGGSIELDGAGTILAAEGGKDGSYTITDANPSEVLK